MQSATVIIALLMAHSLVDYPLRTAALMALIAFSCALLAEPPQVAPQATSAHAHSRARARPAGPSRSRPATAPYPAPADVAAAAPPSSAPAPPRHDDRQWPEAWRRPLGEEKKS
jgi:hypothetical protein